MVGSTIHHYRIIRQLGAGGMGVVYEAEDTRLRRPVAIKFLPESLGVAPENVERFQREARIASSLNHPNICTIYDVGVHEGRHFIVMERLEGESLRSRAHGQPLAVAQILDVGCQLADALDAAHGQGIVHRDIKPANVFLTKRGQAKLLDFGIAKLGDDPRERDATAETRAAAEALTTPGTTVGSINYMSPEQARGEDLDARTDLFSLGLVLYEMATGREAFEGRTTAVVFDAILNRQPPDPRTINPAVPEDLARVIARALEKDRRLRFQTAADMLSELSRIRASGSVATSASTVGAGLQGASASIGATRDGTTATSPEHRASRRLPTAALIALLVAVAAAGVGAWFLWLRPSPAPLTVQDTVLVADFVNTTGDAVFDDALRQAVAVQLQQTPFLTLLPDLRIQRTMRMMQQAPDTAVTAELAREACQRAGAKATVEGSIAPLGSSYVISLGVHNCQTGASLARAQVQASSKEDVLNQVGAAVRTLREGLGESLATIQKYDVPVTEATTRSLEALRAYGQGLRARATRGDEDAIPFFKRAIELDPGFALAHAKLGVVSGNIGRANDAREHAQKAWDLRDKVSEYERLYINWNYASRVTNDQKAVKEALEILTTAYPRDFAARNNLGVYYNTIGQQEDALREYKAAADLAPDEPSPLANVAYVLLQLGRFDEASTYIDRVLSMRPDFNLAVTRWLIASTSGSPRAAEFEKAARAIAPPDPIRMAESSLASWHGRFKEFEALQDDLMSRAEAAGNSEVARATRVGRLFTLAAYRRGADLQALEAHAAKEQEPALLTQYVSALAFLGRTDAARAGMRRLESIEKANTDLGPAATVARAYLLADAGRISEGIAMLQTTMAAHPRARDLHFFAADLRERTGDLDAAIEGYRLVVDSITFLGANPIIAGARLKLADALLRKGDVSGAQAQVDVLLEQWKDADQEFWALGEARALREKILARQKQDAGSQRQE